MVNRGKALDAEVELERKRFEALGARHMVALERCRSQVAATWGDVPHFDPFDGGDEATCLLLLETPGPRAGAIRFVSRDNPTATARNLTRFCDMAGLPRQRMVLWNAVPWVIHAPGARNRAPRRAEIVAGIALVPGLLECLPRLRVVVLAGSVAARAASLIAQTRPELQVLAMPHPSPVYVNTALTIAPGIVSTLRKAAALLDAPENAVSSS